MATQTTNYGLEKPAWDDMADVSALNNNSDIIDAQMYANELSAKQAVANMADAYDATATYAEGDYCTYGGKLYQANTDISVAEAFDATHWDETTAAEHFSDGGGGGGTLIQPVIYSDTEREVGVWRDGKPLYQRTIYYAGGSYGNVSFNHGIADIDMPVKIEGVAADNEMANTYQLIPRSDNANNIIMATQVSRTQITYAVSQAFSSRVVNIYFTVWYTKTTDTPGSGTWTPSGVPAVHYSEDEQVVGTWIDGSTIYEKTWIFNSSVTCASNSWSDTPISASGIASIIDGKVYDVSNGGNLIALWGNVGISCDGTYIQILNTRNIAIGVKCMTLQYLKSST